MPKIQIDKKTSLSSGDSFTKIKDFLSQDPDLKKLDPSYKCQFQEQALTGSAKGKMFDAELKVQGDGAGSNVSLVVNIPFMVTPFKGKIEAILNKKLDTLLG